jgi:hypothetical protein
VGLLATCFHAVSCSTYSLTLKMEATCFPQMSVDVQKTAWHYVPEYETLE